jgi:hypothetical protein
MVTTIIVGVDLGVHDKVNMQKNGPLETPKAFIKL